MVKVLENRVVDLDIVPGTKDGADLKNQADAATYVAPPPHSTSNSAIYLTSIKRS